MRSIVIIKKTGVVETKNVKEINFDAVYKYASLKKADNFERRHTWKTKKSGYVHMYAKDSGRSNTINKYELPPPVDTPLYYGTICLIKTSGKHQKVDDVIDYTEDAWEKDYESLMGGFEDLGEEDSYESDELENYPKECLTKEGYLKDGFIVENSEDSDEDNDIDELSDEEEGEYEEYSEEDDGDGDNYDSEHGSNNYNGDNEYESDISELDTDELTEEEYSSDDE